MKNLYTSASADVPASGMSEPTENNQETSNEGLLNNEHPNESLVASSAGETNPSGTLGTIPFHDTQGTIEVNGGGQLQYTLPIALPPGVKSVAPQVNLVYNSGSGNGIAGYGWNISGVTSISRMGRNVDKDGEIRTIQFDYTDYYMFNGQRLILQSGEYGKDGATYVTEKYSNVKIRSLGQNYEQTGPASFEVTFEDGSQAWYGSHSDARTPMEYNIARWQDVQGNYIVYNYMQIRNVAVIRFIEWGGNESTGTPNFNSITFVYQSRDRWETSYIKGKEFVQTNLLSNVEVTANGNPFKKYTIAYGKDNKGNHYEFLKSITETNAAGETANPVTFEYKQSEQGAWKQTLTTRDTSPDLLYGDFDGDGKIDILKYMDAFEECLRYEEIYHEEGYYNDEGEYQSGYWEQSCIEPVDHPAGIYHFSSVFDDDKPKEVHVGSLVTKNQLKNAIVFNLKNAEEEVLSRQGFLVYETPDSTTSTEEGRRDLVIKGYSVSTDSANRQLKEEFVRIIPADDYDTTILRDYSNPDVNQYWHDTSIEEVKEVDLDGDGISELIFVLQDIISWEVIPEGPNGEIQLPEVRTEISYRYLLVRPSESDPDKLARPIYLNSLYTNFFQAAYQGDFNGDGCVDFITFDGVGRPYLTAFKKDTSEDFYAFSTIYLATPIAGLRNKAIVGDFTGDGKTDLLVPQALDSRQWKLYSSTGNNFKVQTLENFELYKESDTFYGRTHSRAISRQYFAQDLNKDGKADFIAFYSHIYLDDDENGTSKFMILYHENKGIDTNGNVVFEQKNIDGSTLNKIREAGDEYKMDWYPQEYDLFTTDVKGYAFLKWKGKNPIHFSPIVGDFRVNSFNENIIVFVRGKLLKYSHYSVAEEARIISITQGGIMTKIKYDELDPKVNPGFYAGVKKEKYPYVELDRLPRTFIVSQLQQENRKQRFKYRGFVAHVLGKGMIGFRQSARSSWYTDEFENTVIWNGNEIDPLNEGLPVKEWSVRTLNDDQLIFPEDLSVNNTQLLSFKSIAYNKTSPSMGVLAIVPLKTVTKDFLQEITKENTVLYGDYYLPTETISIVNDGFATTRTVLEYTHNPDGTGKDYFIGRPISKIETVNAYGDIKIAKEEYFYEKNLLQARKTYNRDNSGWIQEEYRYDTFGNITEKTVTNSIDDMTQVQKNQYDPKGRFVVKKIDNLNLETNITYNDLGQVLTQIDPLGNTLTNTYDGWGKSLTFITSLEGITTFTYEKLDEGGNKVTEYAPDGTTKEIFTNKVGQQYQVRTRGFNQEGYLVSNGAIDAWIDQGVNTHIIVRTNYDDLGRKIAESEPYFEGAAIKWNSISYDDTTFPAIVTATSFNGKQMKTIQSGRTTIVEELNGYIRIIKKTTDPLGNVIHSEDKGGVINFSYNAAGQQVKAQYGDNVVITEYDAWGRKSKFEDPSNGTYHYEYNGFGQIMKLISPKGYKEYQYNTKGQLIQQIEKSNEAGLTDKDIYFSYNAKGIITSKTGTSNSEFYAVTLVYDTFGRLLENREQSHERTYIEKNFQYDDQSRIVGYEKMLNSTGIDTKVVIEHVYDEWSGLLYQIKDGTTGQELWRLQENQANGQLVRSRHGASAIKNIYDDQNFLIESQHKSSIGQIFGSTYTFDAVRNELKERTREGNFGLTETFTYDDNNRLIEWTDPKNGGRSSNVYDIQGRITAIDKLGTVRFENGAKIYQPTRIALHEIGKQNYTNDLIQEIVYNENNDPIYITGQQSDVRFGYGLSNMRQMVTCGGKATNSEIIDPTNSDWEGLFTKYYSTDGSLEVIRNNTTGEEKHILYIGGSPYESNIVYLKDYSESSGSYKFLHKDYLGSILAITGEDGTLLEERHFDAWGNLTHGTMDLLDRGYTSHEHFDEIGIVHMNGRLYDPSLRRFLNADEHIQDMFNTQNYNKYGYVLNNPLMYNDPNGEVFFFAFLGVWAFWKAVIIGAAIGLASYVVGLAVAGDLSSLSFGGALKATLFGAISGAVTFGLGTIFKAATDTLGNALLQAGAHGVSQGVLGLLQGEKFLSSVAGGLFGSLGAYGWGQMMNGLGLAQFSQSTYGMVGFGALSGGIGAELTGGNFWQGAITGGIVSGLNHAMHKLDWKGNQQDDLYRRVSTDELTQEEFNEYIRQNREQADKIADYVKQAGLLVGTVPTDMASLRDFVKDLFKFKWTAIGKLFSVKTLLGTHIYLTGQQFSDYSEMLGNVKYNYDKIHGNSAGKGVKVVETRYHTPAFGGTGSTSYDFYDIKTKKYLGGD